MRMAVGLFAFLCASSAAAEEPETAHNNVAMLGAGMTLTLSGCSLLMSAAISAYAYSQSMVDRFEPVMMGMSLSLLGMAALDTGVPMWMVGSSPAPEGRTRRSRALYGMGIALTTIGVAAIPPGSYVLVVGARGHASAAVRPESFRAFDQRMLIAGTATVASSALAIGAGVGMYLWGRELEPGHETATVVVSPAPDGFRLSF